MEQRVSRVTQPQPSIAGSCGTSRSATLNPTLNLRFMRTLPFGYTGDELVTAVVDDDRHVLYTLSKPETKGLHWEPHTLPVKTYSGKQGRKREANRGVN